MTPLGLLFVSFVLGIRHALDPDHLVAVATILTREKSVRLASRIGAFWGLGHSLTILVVGGSIILFGIAVPTRVGLALEFLVALMLILLGVNAATRRSSHAPPPHRHGVPAPATKHAADPSLRRPLIVGTVHGLAGSAGVALMILTTIRDPILALGYLAIFGLGTMAAMVLLTSAFAVPLLYSARNSLPVGRAVQLGSAFLSVAFGVFLVYRIGVVDGLFSDAPRWTPE